MVVAALIQLAVAAPIGALFGAAYGTSIRIGYEIIFPALFKNQEPTKDAQGVLTAMTQMFTGVGGLEAQNFGINQGIKNALKAIDADPELTELIKKNSNLDTQTITVNLSGTSTSASSEQSLFSPSSGVDTTGGRAGRLQGLQTGLDIAKAQHNITKASAIYIEAMQIMGYIPNQNQLEQLFKTGSFTHFSLNWILALMDRNLQQRFFKQLQDYQTAGRIVTAGSSQASQARAAAAVQRQKDIQSFGSTQIKLTTQQQALIDRQKSLGQLPKAGQTQILERNRLIKTIAQQALSVKAKTQKLADLKRFGTNNPRAIKNAADSIILAKRSMANTQRLLTALLQRYRFT